LFRGHLNDPDHPQILGAIKEVLARNDLYGLGVDPKGALSPAQAISVQTQMNMPAVHLASLSDQELETYQKLLLELPRVVARGGTQDRAEQVAMTRKQLRPLAPPLGSCDSGPHTCCSSWRLRFSYSGGRICRRSAGASARRFGDSRRPSRKATRMRLRSNGLRLIERPSGLVRQKVAEG